MVEGKQVVVWRCPYYIKWKDMLRRCYAKDKYRSYNTKVCPEWLVFSNFKDWVVSCGLQEEDLKVLDLDKDLFGDGTLYSPAVCIFVSHKVNTFILDKNNTPSLCLRGVYCREGKYLPRCNNPITKKRESLGSYICEIQAHRKWCDRKLEILESLKYEYQIPLNVYNKIKLKFQYDA